MKTLTPKLQMSSLACKLLITLTCCLINSPQTAFAQPEGFSSVIAEEKFQVIYLMTQPVTQPLPKKSKLVPLKDLEFTGPQPSHPIVLGTFVNDGQWGIVDGHLMVYEGKNAALQLAWADQFELEGIMEQTGHGGWFLLVGWQGGRGFAVHSATTRQSGSPWFLTEFRGNKAIPERTVEFEKFLWKDAQPFRLRVENNSLSLDVGKSRVIDEQPLSGYAPGSIIIGVYDTVYGPRPLRIRSMRIRALPEAAEEPEE